MQYKVVKNFYLAQEDTTYWDGDIVEMTEEQANEINRKAREKHGMGDFLEPLGKAEVKPKKSKSKADD